MNPKSLIIIDDSKACIASSLNAYQGERMFNDRFDLLEANRNLVSDEKLKNKYSDEEKATLRNVYECYTWKGVIYNRVNEFNSFSSLVTVPKDENEKSRAGRPPKEVKQINANNFYNALETVLKEKDKVIISYNYLGNDNVSYGHNVCVFYNGGNYRSVDRINRYKAGYVTNLIGDTLDSGTKFIKDNRFSIELKPKNRPKYLPAPVRSVFLYTYDT